VGAVTRRAAAAPIRLLHVRRIRIGEARLAHLGERGKTLLSVGDAGAVVGVVFEFEPRLSEGRVPSARPVFMTNLALARSVGLRMALPRTNLRGRPWNMIQIS
jgi:hypothetical protein